MPSRFGKKKTAQQASRQSWLAPADARSAEMADALRRIAPPSESPRAS